MDLFARIQAHDWDAKIDDSPALVTERMELLLAIRAMPVNTLAPYLAKLPVELVVKILNLVKATL